MAPYIFLYSFIIFFPLLDDLFKNKLKFKKLYCNLVLLFLLLILGLRHSSMGMDLSGYLNSFSVLNKLSLKEVLLSLSFLNYEKGYLILNKLVGMITFGNQQIFLFVCAILSTSPVYYLIREKSENALFSWIIYLGLPIFILQFSGLRQCIAIGLCCLSLIYIEDKKLLKVALLVLLASQFHYTAFIFLISYFLYHIKISNNLRWMTILMFPLIYIFRKNIFLFVSVIFKQNAIIEQTNAITMMLVFILIYIFLVILFYGKYTERINGYMNIYFFACICMIFSGVNSIAMRVAYYFMFPLVLLLPVALNKIKDKRLSFILLSLIIICFILFAFDSIVNTYWAQAYPYYGFWENIY